MPSRLKLWLVRAGFHRFLRDGYWIRSDGKIVGIGDTYTVTKHDTGWYISHIGPPRSLSGHSSIKYPPG